MRKVHSPWLRFLSFPAAKCNVCSFMLSFICFNLMLSRTMRSTWPVVSNEKCWEWNLFPFSLRREGAYDVNFLSIWNFKSIKISWEADYIHRTHRVNTALFFLSRVSSECSLPHLQCLLRESNPCFRGPSQKWALRAGWAPNHRTKKNRADDAVADIWALHTHPSLK